MEYRKGEEEMDGTSFFVYVSLCVYDWKEWNGNG